MKISARRVVNRLVGTAIDLGVSNARELDPDGVYGEKLTAALDELARANGSPHQRVMLDEIEVTARLTGRGTPLHLHGVWSAAVNDWLVWLKAESEVENEKRAFEERRLRA